MVTAPGPGPTSAGEIVVWEWDPFTPNNPNGARLQRLGPDQFTWAGSSTYGANVAVGTFE
ncbi:MAG: hypothetical protein U0166_05830 [Acidobacteriota bacterium]